MCGTNDGPNAIHDLRSCVRPRCAARNTESSVQGRPERCRQKLTYTHSHEYDCIVRNEAVLRPAKPSPYQLPDSAFDTVAAWFLDRGHEAVNQGCGPPGSTSLGMPSSEPPALENFGTFGGDWGAYEEHLRRIFSRDVVRGSLGLGHESVKCSDQRFWHCISEGPD